MREFFRRQSVVPFETLIAALAMFSGALGLLKFKGVTIDALSLLLPAWFLALSQALYLASGLGMFFGVGFGKAGVEGFGLVVLAASVVARALALLEVAGWTAQVATSLWFNAIVVIACAVRLHTLTKREVIVKLESQ